MNHNDKRKINRVQGGWSKNEVNKNNSQNFQDKKPVDYSTNEALKFDYTVKTENNSTFECIEISKDISIDLNSKLKINQFDKLPAKIALTNNFISKDDSEWFFQYFQQNLPWSQKENATPRGEKYLEPRKTCWYGLPYAYSSVTMTPNDNWDVNLFELLQKVQRCSPPDRPFNSVMCNLYEGSKNSIDWHADDERSLGKSPVIASISLGATRTFELCQRSELFSGGYNNKSKNPYRSRNRNEPPFQGCSLLYQVFLESGSLLVMSGSVQDDWLHRVPKEYHDQQPRINFTFRHIVSGK